MDADWAPFPIRGSDGGLIFWAARPSDSETFPLRDLAVTKTLLRISFPIDHDHAGESTFRAVVV